MATKETGLERRDPLKKTDASAVALAGNYLWGDALAVSRDRVTIYHYTVADSINPTDQSSGPKATAAAISFTEDVYRAVRN